MKNFLIEQLERTNYWLSFSEAKNAALVALNVAIIAVCTQIDMLGMIMQVVLCILFLVSTACCLLSFSPNLKNKADGRGVDTIENCNLIFYGDIAKLGASDTYMSCVKDRYKLEVDEDEKYLYEDLAEEIVINSQIAVGKYRMFKKAIFIDILAVVVLAISLIVA